VGSSYPKDLKRLAAEYGFAVALTRGSHYMLTHPHVKNAIYASCSPRQPGRALANVRADLKRALRTIPRDNTR